MRLKVVPIRLSDCSRAFFRNNVFVVLPDRLTCWNPHCGGAWKIRADRKKAIIKRLNKRGRQKLTCPKCRLTHLMEIPEKWREGTWTVRFGQAV